MIVMGAIVPHPPILLPQIGQGRERQAQATRNAYDEVAERLRELEARRLLLISTHGIVTLNRFHVLDAELSGSFERFGWPGLTFGREVDAEMVSAVVAAAEAGDVPLGRASRWEESDHSCGVPLLLLGDAVPPRIGVVSMSFRSAAEHVRFGRALGEALAGLSEPTAVLASGDAVHRLDESSPQRAHPRGAEVQAAYEQALSAWDCEALCSLDEELRREVDESVVSPTLMLMGCLSSGAEWTPSVRILAAEHPWGVGYVTALVERGGDGG